MALFLGRMIFLIDRLSASQANFDEQIRVLSAPSFAEAESQFDQIGLHEEFSFNDHQRAKVCWKYICTRDIFIVPETSTGSLLYSNTIECEDAVSYIRFIKQNKFPLQTESPFPHVSKP